MPLFSLLPGNRACRLPQIFSITKDSLIEPSFNQNSLKVAHQWYFSNSNEIGLLRSTCYRFFWKAVIMAIQPCALAILRFACDEDKLPPLISDHIMWLLLTPYRGKRIYCCRMTASVHSPTGGKLFDIADWQSLTLSATIAQPQHRLAAFRLGCDKVKKL